MKAILGGMTAIMAACCCAGPLRAAPAEPAEPAASAPLNLPLEGETVHPSWSALPTGDDLAREYPPLAMALGLGGRARMTCQAEPDGRVAECRVLSEAPTGLGFGAAALRLSAYFTMNPARLDGKAVKARVNIPINFQPAQTAPNAAPEPPPPPSSPAALELARKVVVLENYTERMRTKSRPDMDRMAAAAVVNGDGQAGETALDALRQGLEDTIAEQADLRARMMAARMTESDLRATAAYLASPAGKAWTDAEAQSDQVLPKAFAARLATSSQAHLCAQVRCSPAQTAP